MSGWRITFAIPKVTMQPIVFHFEDFYDFKELLYKWLKYAEIKQLEIFVEKEIEK